MSAQEPVIQLLGAYLAFVYGVIYRQYLHLSILLPSVLA